MNTDFSRSKRKARMLFTLADAGERENLPLITLPAQ